MTAAKSASKAAKALSWAMFFTIGGSLYGAILALGFVGLIFYNRWNYRKMKEESEAEDEYFGRRFEEEKARGSMYSWRDSFHGRSDRQRGPIQTMSDSTMDNSTCLGGPRGSYPSASQGVESAVDLRGRPRESDQKMGEEEDITDGRYSLRKGSSPTTTHLPHRGKSGRRSASLESIESWEA